MRLMKSLNPFKPAIFLWCALSVFVAPSHIFAQVPDSATRTADPARIQNDFLRQSDIPDVSERIEVRDLILQQAPAGAENITFILNDITLRGASVYETDELADYYNHQIGQTITLANIYGIASALTNKYRNDGYILTQVIVPPQTIDDGRVTLQVVEGYIDDISIEGVDASQTESVIEQYLYGLNAGQALNVDDLERSLLLISDLAGLDARSVLSPSSHKTGAADLQIIVERDLYDASIGVNNHGSRYLGALQFTAAASLNSLFGNNERITAQFVGAPDPDTNARADLELGFFSLAYEQPLPSLGEGTGLEILGSFTDTTPGFDLSQFEVEGVSRFARIKLEHPFLRSRSRNFNGYISFDWRDVQSKSIVQDTIEDNIRALRLGGEYEFLDTAFGVGINAFRFELSRGLDVFGASSRGDANLTRGFGNPTFEKATFDLQRIQRLGGGFNLLLGANGQISDGPLLSSEEFGVGGNGFGRGYDPSEIVGDEGVTAKLELQWNNAFTIEEAERVQLFSFMDAGRVWNDDGTTSDQKRSSLSSTGLGLRTTFKNGVDADAYVALPLSRDVDTTGHQEPRFFFNVNRAF